MNLLEYEAKGILQTFDIPTPKGSTFRIGDALPQAPVVLKSQVHTGGRGLVTGVRIVRAQADMEHEANEILSLTIKGEKPETLLAEELLLITREYYLSVVIDRTAGEVEFIAHKQGGIEVESHTLDEFWHKVADIKHIDDLGESLAEYYELPEQTFALQELLRSLYDCFTRSDATLLEINPLILTEQNTLVAGDCKMVLDDDAAYRHPEWDFELMPTSANFVPLRWSGTVATIANGAGLAMATVDAVERAGFTPANFLDIGGSATVEGIVQSFKSILEFPKVSSIIINIFGGIVRCDDVATAILQARQQFPSLPALYIRLSGTRSDEAAKLLADAGLQLYPDLPACLREIDHA